MRFVFQCRGGHPVRTALLLLVLTALAVLCGCAKKTEPETGASASHPAVSGASETALPDADAALSALFAGAAGEVFSLPMVPGEPDPDTLAVRPAEVVLCTKPVRIPNRVYRLRVSSGYRAGLCLLSGAGASARLDAGDGTLWYGCAGSRTAFTLTRADGAPIAAAEAAALTVELLDPAAAEDLGNGLKRPVPVWGTAGSYAESLSVTAGEIVSSPIPLSDGGLGVLFDGDGAGAANTYRAAAFRLTDAGMEPASEETLRRLSETGALPAQSLYLPAAADTYVALILPATADPALLTLTSGAFTHPAEDRVTGLFQMGLRLDDAPDGGKILQMIKYEIKNGLEHLGALIPVSDVVRVRCDPRFELLAQIWAAGEDGVLKKVRTLWNGMQPGGDTPRGFAELSQPGDEGYLLLCVRRRAEPLTTPAGVFSVKSRGMGGLRGFEEVKAGVEIEYAPGRAPRTVGIANDVIRQNLQDLIDLRVPYAYPGTYRTLTQNWESPITEHFDQSFTLYSGRYYANGALHNVTPVSYLTSAANPNSRYYMYGDNRGYGSTCISFALTVLGLPETYSMTQLWRDPLLKFDRYAFERRRDLGAVVPGDLLLEINTTSFKGHVMLVRELIYDGDGRLRALSVVESWPPYARQRTFYFLNEETADGTLMTSVLAPELDPYVCGLRLRDGYARPLRDTFDMSPDITVGTVMCDRGTDGLYCIGDGFAEFSVSDESARTLYILREGKKVVQISLANAERRNGLRVASFVGILTAPGTYTVRTSPDGADQERFHVAAPVKGYTIERAPGTPENGGVGAVTFRIPSMEQFDHIEIFYRYADTEGEAETESETEKEDGETLYISDFHPREEIALTTGADGSVIGTFTVPDKKNGRVYSSSRVVYRTPYGTFWTAYEKQKLRQSSDGR